MNHSGNSMETWLLFGTWHLTDKNATSFRDNKEVEGGDLVPVFCPPVDLQPKFISEIAPDGHRYVYQRTAGKGEKEEKDPPPKSWKEAITDDENWIRERKSKYRYLEQNEINHSESKILDFIDKGGQILFNKTSIGHINRNELFLHDNLHFVGPEEKEDLAEVLFEKNSDLYSDKLGVFRHKPGIETFKNEYYFDQDRGK